MTESTKHRVLFLCVHNSGRSRMAEEWLHRLGGDAFEVASAGFEPREMLSIVQQVLEEGGKLHIDKAINPSVFDLYRAGRHFHTVIAVCDAKNAEQCPIFPSVVVRHDWSFPDPSEFHGSDLEIKQNVRELNQQIKFRIQSWLGTLDN